LDRREAILLLREISDFPEATMVSCVFLNHKHGIPSSTEDGYELYIKMQSGLSAGKNIERVAMEHQLKVRESRGFIVIYSPEPMLQVTA
jgi:hypothetical protein